MPEGGTAMDPAIKRLFDGPNYAHVSTVMADGSPQVAPVWIGTEGDRAVFYKSESSIAYRNLRRDPRLAISIVAFDNPYHGGYARGRAVEFRGSDEAAQWLTEMAVGYTGKPYPREHLEEGLPAVLVLVELERCTAFDASHMKHAPQAA